MQDWDDRTSWDRYFAERIKNDLAPCDGFGPFDPPEIPQVATQLQTRGWTSIWVPGCGLSWLPTLLAESGLTVYATDFSTVAIKHQASGKIDVSSITMKWTGSYSKGKLICEEHYPKRGQDWFLADGSVVLTARNCGQKPVLTSFRIVSYEDPGYPPYIVV